jgi:hypothetical protein
MCFVGHTYIDIGDVRSSNMRDGPSAQDLDYKRMKLDTKRANFVKLCAILFCSL